MADLYDRVSPGLDSPPEDGQAVTPDDNTDLAVASRCFWVGVSGALRVTTIKGTVLTLPAVAAGMWHPLRIKRVHATGTTATGIFVGW